MIHLLWRYGIQLGISVGIFQNVGRIIMTREMIIFMVGCIVGTLSARVVAYQIKREKGGK